MTSSILGGFTPVSCRTTVRPAERVSDTKWRNGLTNASVRRPLKDRRIRIEEISRFFRKIFKKICRNSGERKASGHCTIGFKMFSIDHLKIRPKWEIFFKDETSWLRGYTPLRNRGQRSACGSHSARQTHQCGLWSFSDFMNRNFETIFFGLHEQS